MSAGRSPVVRVAGFEGPVDELVRRAHAGEVDLREVDLTSMVRAYLDGLRGEVDLEEATEFLWAAAALVEMKSRLLLPPKPPAPEPAVAQEEATDLAEQLRQQVEEYRVFREAAEALAALEAVQRRVFTRPPEEGSEGELPLVGLTVQDLFAAFRRVLERSEKPVEEVPREGVTVADCMRAILARLAASPHGLQFDELFEPASPRIVVIVTFLALLELVRRRRLRVAQMEPFGPIRLYAAGGEA
ncbi:MAG: segregation/condensation protein A [Armatimonadota bacterium]|nr:segregation/condensation protein A [Armatimonadota bacterium]MDW8156163.1 segregation/condensation protein A [Armatimonadota bacterium]